MTHQVEQMAYVGRTPWHGLGNRLPERQPLEVWIEQAGLDWMIYETPVQFASDNNGHSNSYISFNKHKVLYRSDTHAPLSVVSQRYQVVQPREIIEFYRDLTEKSGFELETAGSLKGGRKIWALARTGQSGILKGNDRTDAYVLLATACDGSLATRAQFTSVRVVCNNTLAVALDEQSRCVKASHRSAFNAEAMKKKLGISVSTWDDFMYSLKTLSERKVTQTEAREFIRALFQPHPEQAAQKSGERAMHRIDALFNGEGRGAHLPSSCGTAYGLLNAVTEFVDHEKLACSNDHRLDSAWFSQGATLKQRALQQARKLTA